MADAKITQLNEDTTPEFTDLIATVEDPSGTPETKKVTLANVFDLFHPVGTLYFNDANATNPGTLFGVGTWEAVTDRVIVGAGSTFSAQETGGSDEVTLTTTELPAHTHSAGTLRTNNAGNHTHSTGGFATEGSSGSANWGNVQTDGGLSKNRAARLTESDGSHDHDVINSTGSSGSGEAFGVMNPYYGAYVWRRTA